MTVIASIIASIMTVVVIVIMTISIDMITDIIHTIIMIVHTHTKGERHAILVSNANATTAVQFL
jgi:hypothetical protein